MYVTRRNMEKAVADLTKKLQHASDVIAVCVNLLLGIFLLYLYVTMFVRYCILIALESYEATLS